MPEFGEWWLLGSEPKPRFARKQYRFLAAILHYMLTEGLIDAEAIKVFAKALSNTGPAFNRDRFIGWAIDGENNGRDTDVHDA